MAGLKANGVPGVFAVANNVQSKKTLGRKTALTQSRIPNPSAQL